MAILSSHVLNGLDGSHAGGVEVCLVNLASGQVLFNTTTDSQGRLLETIDLQNTDPDDRYELVFRTENYWRSAGVVTEHCINEIVLRFVAPDKEARYHRPIIVSPYSYSTWASVPE